MDREIVDGRRLVVNKITKTKRNEQQTNHQFGLFIYFRSILQNQNKRHLNYQENLH